MEPDKALIRGCQDGDLSAFDRLYTRYSSAMYGLCLRYARDREEAQDLLQEGFIKVYEKIKQYSGEGSFEGWMRRLFVNLALDQYKSKKRELERMQTYAEEGGADTDDPSPWPNARKRNSSTSSNNSPKVTGWCLTSSPWRASPTATSPNSWGCPKAPVKHNSLKHVNNSAGCWMPTSAGRN